MLTSYLQLPLAFGLLVSGMSGKNVLGLAGGNTKKRGNKKFSESIPPIRYRFEPGRLGKGWGSLREHGQYVEL